MNRPAVALAIAVAIGAIASTARAEPSLLERAADSVREVRYEEAAELIDRALDSGSLDAGEMAEAHRMAGEVRAALGQSDAARDQFLRFLLLRPDGAITPGSSPKITGPFDSARERLAAVGPLEVDVRAERDGPRIHIQLVVQSDPVGMVSGIVVRYRLDGADEQVARVPVTPSAEIDAAPGVELRAVVSATDSRGNELVRLGSWDRPIEVSPAPARRDIAVPATPPPRRRPLYQQWYAWTALTALTAGTGVFFALQMEQTADELDRLTRDSEQHQFSDALELERRGDRQALIANIAFGAAGVTAVVAIAMAVRGTYEPSRAPAVTAVAGPGSAGLIARWRF